MQQRDNKWVDLAIAGITAAAILAPLLSHDAHARALMLSARNHVVYYAKRVARDLRHLTDAPWQRELADEPGEVFQLFATPEPTWYADAVE